MAFFQMSSDTETEGSSGSAPLAQRTKQRPLSSLWQRLSSNLQCTAVAWQPLEHLRRGVEKGGKAGQGFVPARYELFVAPSAAFFSSLAADNTAVEGARNWAVER